MLIDFYLLKFNEFIDCMPFAYQLANKAYQQGHLIKIQFADEASQLFFDKLLWEFQPDSFIPHHITNSSTEKWLIIGNRQLTNDNELIKLQINLHITTEPTSAHCERLLQIVPNHPAYLELARTQYRHYRNLNYPLKSHQIN